MKTICMIQIKDGDLLYPNRPNDMQGFIKKISSNKQYSSEISEFINACPSHNHEKIIKDYSLRDDLDSIKWVRVVCTKNRKCSDVTNPDCWNISVKGMPPWFERQYGFYMNNIRNSIKKIMVRNR